MNTHRQLGITTNGGAKATEKLSSGFRINRAGDDAAGLAISEKMRGQIRGLTQASRNAQDGISLIQTAEGALNETHAILQRMRELAVQAATDTNTAEDRIEIQKEIDQLKSEIDRIGNTTEFNTKKLVDGSQAQQAKLDDTNAAALLGAKAINPMDEGEYTVTVANKKDVAANFNIGGTGLGADAVTFGNDVNIGNGFKLVVSSFDDTATNTDTKFTLTLQDQNGIQIGSTVDVAANNAADVTVGDDDGIVITTAGIGAITANGTATFDFGVSANYTVVNNGVTVQSITDEVTSNGKVTVGGFELNLDKTLTAGSTTIDVSGKALQLQVGANENQSIRLAMGDMRTSALEVDQINVNSHDNAKAAITTIDGAIQSVSAERSKLGALQNRLEHTIKNLDTSAENLQASESRIRDVDMAKEMMEFTKQNILQQASTAMLAQANMAPQSVLQLLG